MCEEERGGRRLKAEGGIRQCAGTFIRDKAEENRFVPDDISID